MNTTAKLLLHCPDQPGILAEVTNFITINRGNIVYLDQYVDHVENIFFMRIEWEIKDFFIPKDKIEDYFETLYAQKYEMKFRLYFSDVKPKMAIFASKMSHCLFDILARYMQVISEQMIEAYHNRIINIHHSFLHAFVGARPYHAAFERGVKIIGATSHYVTTELDARPIIEQDVVRITHKNAVQELVSKGKDLGKIVLSRAVQKHIDRKVLAYKNKTVIFS